MNGETQEHDAAPIPAGPMDELKAMLREVREAAAERAAQARADARAVAVARLAVDMWASRNVHDGSPEAFIDDAIGLLEEAESAVWAMDDAKAASETGAA